MHVQAAGMQYKEDKMRVRACVHRHVCIMCASIVPSQQTHSNESQKAFKDSGYFSNISDKSVVL